MSQQDSVGSVGIDSVESGNLLSAVGRVKSGIRSGARSSTTTAINNARAPSPIARRSSFETKMWDSISKLRGNDSAKTSALENLRRGVTESGLPPPPTRGRRRSSVNRADEIAQALMHLHSQASTPPSGSDSTATTPITTSQSRGQLQSHRRTFSEGSSMAAHIPALTAVNKSVLYGNMAQQLDIAQKDVEQIQQDHVNHFKDVIGCEMGNVLFLNEHTRELLLYDKGAWFRFPSSSGIEGACALTGSTINVPNTAIDLRFNKNIDDATGIRTRSMLCHPIRMNRGGGRVVGVVRMLNKIGTDSFDGHDEEILGVCVQRVADDLHIHFRDLMDLMDRFSSIAKLIVTHSATFKKLDKHYFEHTKGSAMRRNSESDVTIAGHLPSRLSASQRDATGAGVTKRGMTISTKAQSIKDVDALQRKTNRRENYAAQLRSAMSSQNSTDL